MKKTPIALAAGFILVATAAVAGEDHFKKVDADGNGSLSMAEVVAAHPEVDAKLFKSIDRDGDGALSPKEYDVATTAPAKSGSTTQ